MSAVPMRAGVVANGHGDHSDSAGERLTIRRPIAIDLFAGIGGLSLGFEQAGFDVVTSVEYDPVHAGVHAYNFPLTEVVCGTITTLSPDDLRNAVVRGLAKHGREERSWDGEIDVICGGPPCQGFSTMGKRLIDDTRNQLVFHFFRLVRDLRPRYFVMENVPGMKSGGHSSILNRLIAEFESVGYYVTRPIRILNAADYGVPQDRRRLILLGAREGEPTLHYPEPIVIPAPKHAGAEPRPRLRTSAILQVSLPDGPTVWDALGDLPDLDDFPELLTKDEIFLPPTAFRRMEGLARAYARKLREMEPDPHDLSHLRKWERQLLTSSLRTVHTEGSIQRFRATEPGNTEPISRFYRLDAIGLANTLRAGTGSERGAFTSPRPIHPRLPRVISVREAARLHSFPDWFRLHGTKWHGFRQIGNAVPPLLGRAIAAEIVTALRVAPLKPSRAIDLGKKDLLYLNMLAAAERFGANWEAIPQPRQRAATRVPEMAP